ncbi:MAG: hypothetical protein SXQ77_03815 [Halobacteria archaeon]|nr:hypothetical protein [Halobacteria archaeon]
MLRPKQMSKVSVAGSKNVLDDVIETLHDLNIVHVSDYDGSWEGFDNGNPMEGSEEASEKLVQIRSIQNILGIEGDDAATVDLENVDVDARLEEVRKRVNELEDERNEVRDQLR